MNFDEWVFAELVKVGAIKDFSKTPWSGRGKTPKGSLTIKMNKIIELRQSANPNEKIWGLIGATMFPMTEAPKSPSPRTLKEFEEFAKQANPEDPMKLVTVMQKACLGAWQQYQKNFKETV